MGELVHGYCCAVREMSLWVNWYMAIAVLFERWVCVNWYMAIAAAPSER